MSSPQTEGSEILLNRICMKGKECKECIISEQKTVS